jgi:xanthine dehydrogenase accessory factor
MSPEGRPPDLAIDVPLASRGFVDEPSGDTVGPPRTSTIAVRWDTLISSFGSLDRQPDGSSMRELVRRLNHALEANRPMVLCQVVDTRGSTPQKAGAIMVVDPDGGQIGTLGGGCVENEVKQKSLRQLDGTAAALHSYVLDHDYAWADGLICGGKMVIVSQPFRGPEPLAYFRAMGRAIDQGEGCTEAVVVNPEHTAGAALGDRFLFDGIGRVVGRWTERADTPEPAWGVRPLDDRPKPRVERGVAFLPSLPRVRLVVVGAGHVGQAVADLAARADFDVWVVDDRQQYANPERFPLADRLVVGPIGEVLAAMEVSPRTYALIVTRGHGHDEEALFHLAPTPASYVGLIGSRRKIRLIFEGLREQGIEDTALARVAAPVGIDIGSQSVTEIAISIVAELIARRNLGPDALARRGAMSATGSSPTRDE